MVDIHQNESANEIVFSAVSAEAQRWMQENYEAGSVIFRLPHEQIQALEFRRAVDEQGFNVELWRGPRF